MFVQSKLETDSDKYYRPTRLPGAAHRLKTKTILICPSFFMTEWYCSTRQVMFVQSKLETDSNKYYRPTTEAARSCAQSKDQNNINLPCHFS